MWYCIKKNTFQYNSHDITILTVYFFYFLTIFFLDFHFVFKCIKRLFIQKVIQQLTLRYRICEVFINKYVPLYSQYSALDVAKT